MREITVDTETTGISPVQGHRVVEVGCVEMVHRVPTGRTFHRFVNPERDVPEESVKVHGLRSEDLQGKPVFREIADDLLGFLGEATLVMHNAEFDVAFLNAELSRAGRAEIAASRTVDTLELARKKFPGQSNSLDALGKRFRIDLSRRRKRHGALLDAELLAEVYVDLTDSRQQRLTLEPVQVAQRGRSGPAPQRPAPLGPLSTAEERARHRAFVDGLGANALWKEYPEAAS